MTDGSITPVFCGAHNHRKEKLFADVSEIDPMLVDIRQPLRLVPDDDHSIL
jgi:hypothetical protein